MELSRRSFLLGTGVALAAAALPSIPFARAVLQDWEGTRRISEFGFHVNNPPVNESYVNFLLRRNDNVLFNLCVNTRASYRWVAALGGELVMHPQDVWGFEVSPLDDTDAQLWMLYKDEKDIQWAQSILWQGKDFFQADPPTPLEIEACTQLSPTPSETFFTAP